MTTEYEWKDVNEAQWHAWPPHPGKNLAMIEVREKLHPTPAQWRQAVADVNWGDHSAAALQRVVDSVERRARELMAAGFGE